MLTIGMLCSEFGVRPAVGDTPAGKSVEACARAVMVVVVAPCYNHLAGIVQGWEPALVLAFATERPSKLSTKAFCTGSRFTSAPSSRTCAVSALRQGAAH